MERSSEGEVSPHGRATRCRRARWQDRGDRKGVRQLSEQPRGAPAHLRARRRQDRVARDSLMTDRLELDGLRTLVTGGSKGIGQAVADRLREAGARVLATARTAPRDRADADQFIAADITTAE